MSQSVYDDRPFDWVELDKASQSYPDLFRRFLASLPDGSLRCEIGCGAGRNLAGLRERAGLTVGLDLSFVSARSSRRATGNTLRGNALLVPFRDRTFDAVVLDGVAHHTPDPRRAIEEAVRITRAGGRIYIAVYKSGNLYSWLYQTVGSVLRRVSGFRAGRVINDAFALWIYRPAQFLKRRVWRTPDAARNLYSDYFLTPIASFHSREALVSWIERAGASIREIDEFPEGNCRLVIAERR